jgi:hypothetical protein
MDHDTLEERLSRIEECLVRIDERLAQLLGERPARPVEERLAQVEVCVGDLQQQVAYLEGRLGYGINRQSLRRHQSGT